MLAWNDVEKDAFAELLNMGMGQAAASLSAMTDQEVLLSIPQVEFVTFEEVAERIGDHADGDMVSVRQGFQGSVEGDISLLFTKKSSLFLVRELLGDDILLEDLPDIEQESIAEVGNIVLNACMAAIANTLNLDIPTALPEFRHGGLFHSQSAGANEEAPVFLVAQIKFDLKDKGVSGIVVLFLTVSSAIRFKQEIQSLISSYSAAM